MTYLPISPNISLSKEQWDSLHPPLENSLEAWQEWLHRHQCC